MVELKQLELIERIIRVEEGQKATIDLIKEMQRSMERGLNQVDKRFEQADKRFEQVDKRFEQVDKRFEQVDKRFEQVDKCFEQVDKRFQDLREDMNKRFAFIQWFMGIGFALANSLLGWLLLTFLN